MTMGEMTEIFKNVREASRSLVTCEVENINQVLMMLAGATAVEVGAANLVEPFLCKQIIEELPAVMEQYKIESLADIVGKAHV